MIIPDTSGRAQFIEATIANGQTSTGAIDLSGLRLFGISYPSAMTGANVTFKVNVNGAQVAFYKAGAAYSVGINVSTVEWVDPSVMAGHDVVEIISDSAEGAERTLTLIVGRL